MPKVLFLTLVCIVTINLTGCNHYYNENEDMKEKEKIKNMESIRKEVSEIEYFFKLVEIDKFGDEKTIHWDGYMAIMEDDPLDSVDIQDGREITGYEEVIIPNEFEMVYSNEFDDVMVISDTYKDYHIAAKNRDIHIKTIDFVTERERLDESNNYVKIDKDMLRERQIQFFKEYELYIGVAETEGGMYAGYTLIFESNLKDVAYMISVTGIGGLEDIRLDALYTMNRFRVLNDTSSINY